MIYQLVIEYIWDVFRTFQGENVCTSETNIIIALVIIPKKESSFTSLQNVCLNVYDIQVH